MTTHMQSKSKRFAICGAERPEDRAEWRTTTDWVTVTCDKCAARIERERHFDERRLTA